MIPIEIDFVNDWSQGVRKLLSEQGYAVAAETPYDELCHLFLNLRRRLVPRAPRKLLIADSLVCPDEHAPGFALLRQKIERGDDLRPHLSRGLLKLDFDDMLLNDWGLHHLHLGTTLDAQGFVDRTGPVLFVRFTDEEAYLVAILPHGNWTRQELVGVIHRNWPESIKRFRFAGAVGVEPKVTDDEVRQLRKSGVCIILEIEPGVVYAPIGGGYSTAKTSISVVRDCDRVVEQLQRYEDLVKELAPRFLESVRARGLVVEKLVFRLGIFNGVVAAVEESTRSLLPLGASDA